MSLRVRHIAAFGYRFGEIAALGGVPHSGAVESNRQQLVLVDMPHCIERKSCISA